MTPREGPLDDIRVLDLTQFLSGPFATTILADLGADVLKIVRPGDSGSANGALTREQAFDWATNRDKRVLALDLRSEQGRDVSLELVKRADVVIENFRPGALERLGLGHGRLRELNPALVTCDISGYGPTGLWAEMPSYDLTAQAASGSIDITGPHDDPDVPPCRWGVPIGDMAASLYAVIGILAALAVRDRDGSGERVSVSMLDCLLAISTYRAPQVFDAGLSARMHPHKGGRRDDTVRAVPLRRRPLARDRICEASLEGGVRGDGGPGAPRPALRDRSDQEPVRRRARRDHGRDPSAAAGRRVGGDLHRRRSPGREGQHARGGLRPPADRRPRDDQGDRRRERTLGPRRRRPDGHPVHELPARTPLRPRPGRLGRTAPGSACGRRRCADAV